MKVGIPNVTGYAGAELARILYRHPEVEIVSVTGRSMAGQPLGNVYPHLDACDLNIESELSGSLDFVFSALPHAASAERLEPFIREGIRTVDMSADFRLKDLAEYTHWYRVDHPCPDLMEDAVYGLPELHREEIEEASVAATPGCYPTGAILAVAPALAADIIEPDVIVDAKSGVSGAGRQSSIGFGYSEINESVKAYALDGHRHHPEIYQELDNLNQTAELKLTFLTHLIPMTRGILSSCYAPLKEGVLADGEEGIQQVREIYDEFHSGEIFARVVEEPPATKQTTGNNVCAIYPTIDLRSNRLIVVSALDNLVKGAAGAAVQCMNVMSGFPEPAGLEQLALWP